MTAWNQGTGMPSCWVISLAIIYNHYLSAIRLHTAFSVGLKRLKGIRKICFCTSNSSNVSVCMQRKPPISAAGDLSNTSKSRKRAWYKAVRALFRCKSWKKNMKHELISWVSNTWGISRLSAQQFVMILAWQGQPWWQPRGHTFLEIIKQKYLTHGFSLRMWPYQVSILFWFCAAWWLVLPCLRLVGGVVAG